MNYLEIRDFLLLLAKKKLLKIEGGKFCGLFVQLVVIKDIHRDLLEKPSGSLRKKYKNCQLDLFNLISSQSMTPHLFTDYRNIN